MLSYPDILLRNLRKSYYLPHSQSFSYKQLHQNMCNLFVETRSKEISRQTIFDKLSKIIKNLKPLPTNISNNRTSERISTIVDTLNTHSFTPRTILDIGAGAGDIISALQDHYTLPADSVFAIDQKLPTLNNVTTLTYDNNLIPLPDNSIDVIIMFAVLHHIPADIRLNIVKEVSRVLSPKGYVIIREHDDNLDPDFYFFLDLLHLSWYIAKDESVDPLFLMSRNVTTDLFYQVGLQSTHYSTYPEPNPQRIYHEFFNKSP